MQPRTKLQVRVFALSQALPAITKEQTAWAYKYCLIKHEGYRTKTKIACLDCGHQWAGPQKVKTIVCPGCGEKLKVTDTRKKITAQKAYFCILDVTKEFQVVRFFEFRSYHKAGIKAEFFDREIVQQYINPETHKNMVVARNMGFMGSYTDNFHGDMEIRNENNLNDKFNLYETAVYPKQKVLPIYKRNGFKGDFGRCSPYDLFRSIIKYKRCETLLKANQHSLLASHSNTHSYSIDRYWDTIKICIRNGYIVKDSSMWFDYLDFLRYFGKDLRNVKFVCPANLKQEHDRLMVKKNGIEREQRRQRDEEARIRRQAQLEDAIKDYEKARAIFFDIVMQSKNLTIRVLKSVDEFKAEGEALKHCVFTSEYYSKPDSLILSARVEGKPVETIEVSLSTMKIVQARGWDNKPTPYSKEVLKLVRKNLPAIKTRYTKLKTTKAA